MRRTKEDAHKTRAAILEAAECLFLEKGVAHTSLEHIAKQAGVTRGAVYWHFKNKADLFHAMLNQVRLPAEQVAELIQKCGPDNPVAALRDLSCSILAGLAANERKKCIFTILLRRCEFTDELREAEQKHEAFINEFLDFCTRLFAAPDIARQLHPDITPRMGAVTFHAMLIGILHEWLRDPACLDATHARPYMDCLLRGLFPGWNNPPESCKG